MTTPAARQTKPGIESENPMKIKSPVTFILGILLAAFGGWGIVVTNNPAKFIPLFIGLSLVYLGWRGGRKAICRILVMHAAGMTFDRTKRQGDYHFKMPRTAPPCLPPV
jgi:hypothetical protein